MMNRRKKITHFPRMNIGRANIKYQNELKYLGIIIDKNFPFLPHVNYLQTKVDKMIHEIRTMSRAT